MGARRQNRVKYSGSDGRDPYTFLVWLGLVINLFIFTIWHDNILSHLTFLCKGLKAEFRDKRIKISTELYRKGCVESTEEGLEAAIKIGFPVMIKASEGGGGKGIRKSESVEDFPNLFRQVRFCCCELL